MPTQHKAQEIERIKNDIAQASAVYIVGYERLKAAEITKLRKDFRAANSQFHVVKNTLTRKAADQLNHDKLSQYLRGPTAIIVS